MSNKSLLRLIGAEYAYVAEQRELRCSVPVPLLLRADCY